MKSFLKYLLATVVGIIISSVLIFFILFGVVGAIMSSKDKAVEVKQNTVLYLKLNREIVDRKPEVPIFVRAMGAPEQIGLNELLDCIQKAKSDNNIHGIHLDLTYIPAGIATIEEIRNALVDFKESGKFITVYSDFFTQSAYYLATVADKIYFNPEGMFTFVGLRTQSVFIKKALEKLDIEITLIRRGSYKSAGEMFTEEGYSTANREQLSRLISTIWSNIQTNIGESRDATSEELNKMADKLLIKNGYTALEFGLVDSLIYKDQVLDDIRSRIGIDDSDDINTISLSDYVKVPGQKKYKGLAKNKIALMYASGDIVMGEGEDSNIGADKYSRAIRKIRRDSTIKALVLRVNSPGGSAIASEVIWRELWLTRQVKPVVVSMGDLAASGGYYIACTADTIIAQPGTITGSIGVYSMFMNTNGFFSRYGISFDSETTNEHSDFMSGVRSPKALEIAYWETQTDSIYHTFLEHVAEGRPLTFDQAHEIAQGRIWSGIDALEIGLVDKLGGLDDAIQIAGRMAKLDDKFRIVDYPKQEDPFTKMLKELSADVKISLFGKQLTLEPEYELIINRLRNNQGVMTRMPYDITIY